MDSDKPYQAKFLPEISRWPLIALAAILIAAYIRILIIDPGIFLYAMGSLGFVAILFYATLKGTYYVIRGDVLEIFGSFSRRYSISVSLIRSDTVADLPFGGATLSHHRFMASHKGEPGCSGCTT